MGSRKNPGLLEPQDHLLFLDDAQLEKLLVEQMPYAPPEDQIFMNWAVAQLRESLSHRDWLVLEAKYYLDFTQEESCAVAGYQPVFKGRTDRSDRRYAAG